MKDENCYHKIRVQQKLITDKDFNEVRLTKYKKSKHIKLSVNREGMVYISLPFRASFTEAINALNSKRNWLKEQLEDFKKQKLIKKKLFEDGQQISKNQTLKFIQWENLKTSHRLSPSQIIIYYPPNSSIDDIEVQKFTKKIIDKALKLEAQKYLPNRLQELAQKYGFAYHKVFLRNTKTRWGSCSADNNINLNIQLMRLPDEFIDYVIVHELVHTVEKNHSARFWDLLSLKLGEDAKFIDKKLKKYHRESV